jgi:hypothetical protein
MKQILQIDQNFYPERLHQLFVINCPWYMNGLYSIFKPLLDARTTDKFKFMGTDFLDELTTYIGYISYNIYLFIYLFNNLIILYR